MKSQSGSAILWALVWLAGMAAIAYFCLLRHVPTLELATENTLNQALSDIPGNDLNSQSGTNISGTVNGYTATLRGNAQDESQKKGLLALAASTPGVRTVVDELTLSDISVAKADDDTPIVSPSPSQNNTEAESTSSSEAAQPSDTATAVEASDNSTINAANDQADQPTDVAVTQAAPTDEPPATPTQEPTLSFEIEDGTLLLGGQVAATDNVNPLVDQANAVLEIDFISNSVEADETTKPATWIEPITALLPAMDSLEKPSISIQGNQITISGMAADREAHDALITRALQLVGDYALIERIDFEQADPDTIQKLDETNNETSNETSDTKTEGNDGVNDNANEETKNEVAVSVAEETTAASPDVETTAIVKVEEEEAAKPSIAEPQATETSEASTEILDPAARARAAFDALSSTRILFRSGNAVITTETQQVLDNIAQLLMDHPDVEMDIDGHTDASGDANDNLLLSQARANAVRDYLVDRGISVYRLTAYGFGEGVPIAKNDSPEGRALNRRIEFKF